MKQMESKLLGRFGEATAAAAYRKRGYKVLQTNYRCRYGEIDLILEKNGTVVFCEVKLRRDAAFAAAREWVDAAKQEKIIKTALFWMAGVRGRECPARFDVAEIYAPEGLATARPAVNIIPGAFESK